MYFVPAEALLRHVQSARGRAVRAPQIRSGKGACVYLWLQLR
jgi:hypothetical protein